MLERLSNLSRRSPEGKAASSGRSAPGSNWVYGSIAILLVGAISAYQLHLGLNLADEGFLWTGAQRTLWGEVPLRDFMAYEPARYYWSAGWMWLLGSAGIVALRIGLAAFEAIGVFFALKLIGKGRQVGVAYLSICGLILCLWMLPRYKVFDDAVSILLVAALAFLLQAPSVKRCFLVGILVGLTGFMGKNHALYGLLGSLLACIYLAVRNRDVPLHKSLAAGLAGLLVGFAPLLAMCAFVPGYGAALWQSVTFLVGQKSTTLPLPVPWPWRVPFEGLPFSEAGRQMVFGNVFVLLLVGGVGAYVIAIRNKLRSTSNDAVFVAASCLILPYAHVAFSRAAPIHLAQGVFPLLIASLRGAGSFEPKMRLSVAGLVAGLSIFALAPFTIGFPGTDDNWLEVMASGRPLRVDPSTASLVTAVQTLVRKYASGGGRFMVTPFLPGGQALALSKAPEWDLYGLFMRSDDFQRSEIDRIKASDPKFVVIVDDPPDGNQSLLFANTHPLEFRFIEEHFDRVADPSLPPSWKLYIKH